MSDELTALIHRVDLDALVRYVDNTCSDREWEHLIEIRNEARAAVNTGRQLWPIATLANYRLALYAPSHLAVRAFDDAARTFMPGPLSEIIAVHHPWSELEPHLPSGPDRSLVAYERALRGDDISSDETEALDIPLSPMPWEPNYIVAEYDDDGPHCDPPPLPRPGDKSLYHGDPDSADDNVIDDDETTSAIREIFTAWTTESNGKVVVTVVDGSVQDALCAHAVPDARTVALTTAQAFSWLAWAGASGGAHGSRRGLATGRFGVWWLCAAITDTIDDWPLTDPNVQQLITSLQWHLYSDTPESHNNGWSVRLAVHDPNSDISVCIDATDYS